MQLTLSNQVHQIRINRLYQQVDPSLLQRISGLVSPLSDEIASAFYSEMQNLQESRAFLNNDLVDTRLRSTMTEWIRDLFQMRNEAEVMRFIKRQRQVGHVHARINIPMGLVNQGMSIIKNRIGTTILKDGMSKEETGQALMLVNEMLDQAASLINESYVGDLVENQRNEQSLRLHVLSGDVALECERLRAGLFEWAGKMLTYLHDKNAGVQSVESLVHSEVGMWVVHKAEMLFPNSDEIEELGNIISVLDETAYKLKRLEETEKNHFQDYLASLNNLVNNAAWILSVLAEQSVKHEDGRDPLTRVLNRRYLPVIMQHETEISQRQTSPYGAIMLDLDHFKKINDEYGHPIGDEVLKQFCELLLANVRATDFVFRMGGEEFLVLMADASDESVFQVAEKLRSETEKHEFNIDDKHKLSVTTSIGIKMYDGHPDYMRVLKSADEALYQAKQNGRNCIVISGE